MENFNLIIQDEEKEEQQQNKQTESIIIMPIDNNNLIDLNMKPLEDEQFSQDDSNELTNKEDTNLNSIQKETTKMQEKKEEEKSEENLIVTKSDDYKSMIKIFSELNSLTNQKSKLDEEFIESKKFSKPELILLNDENIEFSKSIKNKHTTTDEEKTTKSSYNYDEKLSLKESQNSDNMSNHTSYQELPSVCSRKSQTLVDETATNNKSHMDEDTTSKLILTSTCNEKEDTFENAYLFKKTFLLDQSSKKNNLNTSIQSITSQCTIDSLAKRVQSLVGPIDYKSNKECNKHTSSFESSLLSKQKDQTDTSKHSAINYESIYKELDTIQDTLRIQHSFNKHLEKITASRNEIKDLLQNNNDQLSESNTTFSSATKVSPLSSATSNEHLNLKLPKTNYLSSEFTKSGSSFDFKKESLNSFDYNSKASNNNNNSKTDLRTFKEEETKYFSKKLNDLKSDLEALSLINNSINKNPNLINNNNNKYDYISSSSSINSKQQIPASSLKLQNYLTTSLTRMNNLANFDFNNPTKTTSISRQMCKSAFDNDPDILTSPNKKLLSNSNTKFNENTRKPVNSALFRSNKSNSNTDTETIESSHSESDDAKSPMFSSNVYGSRPNNELPKAYENNIMLSSKQNELTKQTTAHSVGIYDRNTVKKIDFLNKNENDQLDPDYLRQMDKKLKKLIKKNLNQDLRTEKSLNNLKEKENAIAWEIEPIMGENSNNSDKKLDESNVSNGSTVQSYDISHPYLPLRDVPMHEIVKKLQREFELEGTSTANMPTHQMNRLWTEIKSKFNTDDNKKQQEEFSIKQPELDNLTNLIKNPIKTLLESQQDSSNEKKSNIKELLNETPLLKFENFKHLNKEKLKEMIELQKQKHERRVKALEKLAKLERLQAEKLKKILQINQNDESTITSQMFEMFMQSNNFLKKSESNLLGNETITDLNEAFKDEDLSIRIDDKKQKSKNIDKLKSKVEIFNLKNTSVYEPPNGVVVVKEDTNNENMENDARCFFTVPFTTNNKTLNSKSEPLINMDTYSTHKISKSKSYLNKFVPTSSYQSYSANNFNNLFKNMKENMSEMEPRKLSLQEAFETHKFDLISRSRQRQKEIQFRAEQRQRELEDEALQIENYQKRLKTLQMNKKMNVLKKYRAATAAANKNDVIKSNSKGLMFEINVENFMQKRQMTTQDIKKQTRKMYEKLPEVQQKQLKQRAEELKRANRLRSSIYRKTLQQRVLARGPNFNLREAFVN